MNKPNMNVALISMGILASVGGPSALGIRTTKKQRYCNPQDPAPGVSTQLTDNDLKAITDAESKRERKRLAKIAQKIRSEKGITNGPTNN